MFVLLKDWKEKVNVSYAITALLTALWATLVLLYSEAIVLQGALLWSRLSFAVYAFIPIPFLYFFSVFPKEDDIPRTYQLVAWFILAMFFSFISFTDLIIENVLWIRRAAVFVPGPAFLLFVAYFLGFLIYAFYRLMERFNAYKGIDKRQITYVLIGFFLGFIFPVVTNLILPLFGYSLLTRIGPLSTVFTVGFIAYAITKSRLMDISVIISRVVAEILAILIHAVIYIALVWAYRTYVSVNIDLIFVSANIVIGIIVSNTLPMLRIFLQTTSDKLFLHGRYNYYKSLSEASNRVGQDMSLKSILNVLYDTFYSVVEISNPRVFLPEYFFEPEKNSEHFVAYNKETFFPEEKGVNIPLNGELVRELIKKREPVFKPLGIKALLAVPCLLENRLIAFFALDAKLSEDAYTDNDLRLLTVLANQAAIALDHTRSYEKIKTDLDAAQVELERSQRLASLGTMAAGVAHEIRNPLTVIQTETDLLSKAPRDLGQLKTFLFSYNIRPLLSILFTPPVKGLDNQTFSITFLYFTSL